MRGLTTAVLFGCISIVPLVTTAGELPDRTRVRDDITAQLSRQQLSRTFKEPIAKQARSSGPGEQVGILFLRGDGGDPKEVRVDEDTLVLVTARDGSSQLYQNGRPIEVQPAIKESASQIAVALFQSSEGAQVSLSELPVPARKALSRVTEAGVKPQVMFARIVTREDTAKVSDIRASKILMLDASARAVSRSDIVDLVRTAMRTFGLKSDVCDNSADSRCNYPVFAKRLTRLGAKTLFSSARNNADSARRRGSTLALVKTLSDRRWSRGGPLSTRDSRSRRA